MVFRLYWVEKSRKAETITIEKRPPSYRIQGRDGSGRVVLSSLRIGSCRLELLVIASAINLRIKPQCRRCAAFHALARRYKHYVVYRPMPCPFTQARRAFFAPPSLFADADARHISQTIGLCPKLPHQMLLLYGYLRRLLLNIYGSALRPLRAKQLKHLGGLNCTAPLPILVRLANA